MVVASDDRVIDTAAARRFFDDCGAKDKQLVEQPDTGHVVPLDNGWEQLVDLITDFAAETSNG